MKALTRAYNQMIRQGRVNGLHAAQLLSGRSAKRFKERLTHAQVAGWMAALGHVVVARIIKTADEFDDIGDGLRNAMSANGSK